MVAKHAFLHGVLPHADHKPYLLFNSMLFMVEKFVFLDGILAHVDYKPYLLFTMQFIVEK
jgi:hypothetical protein